jgi:hypothetical protein
MKWLLLAVLAVGIARLVWRWRRGADRDRRLMLLCQQAGLDFTPLDLSPDTAWLPFPMFGRPRHGTANVVWDRRRGPEIRVFDYWYEDPTDERAVPPKRRFTCALVPLPASVPRLRVAPRDLADDTMTALGGKEVRFELERFNRRFVVESEDERFAFSFLEQRMMEAFLALPEGVTAEVNEDVLLLFAPLLPAERVLLLFDAAVAIHRRIPRSLGSLFPPRPTRGPHEERWLRGSWSHEETGDVGPRRGRHQAAPSLTPGWTFTVRSWRSGPSLGGPSAPGDRTP